MEFLFQFLAEVLFQALVELPFVWLGFNKKESPGLFSFSLSTFLGIVIGVISIFVLKEHFITNISLRVINLILGPILIGKVFVVMHGKRKNREDKLYLFSSFWNTYIFALSIAIIRFIFV